MIEKKEKKKLSKPDSRFAYTNIDQIIVLEKKDQTILPAKKEVSDNNKNNMQGIS